MPQDSTSGLEQIKNYWLNTRISVDKALSLYVGISDLVEMILPLCRNSLSPTGTLR